MYVVMLESSKDKEKSIEIAKKLSIKLNKDLHIIEDRFLSYNELKTYLKSMKDNNVLITYDDRVLQSSFRGKIDNIFMFKNEEVYNIRELTIRKLRAGHNIRNLYISGEFG